MADYEIRRVSIVTAGLSYIGGACRKCGESAHYFSPEREHRSNPVGAKCRHCETIVWSKADIGPLREKWPEKESSESLDWKERDKRYAYWRRKVLLPAFFAYLPDCPQCGWHEWEIYLPMETYKRYRCAGCNASTHEIDWKNLTTDHLGDEVWWYGPDGWY